MWVSHTGKDPAVFGITVSAWRENWLYWSMTEQGLDTQFSSCLCLSRSSEEWNFMILLQLPAEGGIKKNKTWKTQRSIDFMKQAALFYTLTLMGHRIITVKFEKNNNYFHNGTMYCNIIKRKIYWFGFLVLYNLLLGQHAGCAVGTKNTIRLIDMWIYVYSA